MKVRSRVDYVAGVKAGFLAGLVSLVFFLVSELVSLYLSDLTRPAFWRTFILIAESDIPYSIVIGLIIGIVFAATHDRFLKGIAVELKGMLYGMGYWLLVVLPTVLRQPTAQLFFSSGFFAISVTGFLILGLVLGNLYRRFSSRPHSIVPC